MAITTPFDEFYAATLKASGIDIESRDIAKIAEQNGVDPGLAEMAKYINDRMISDGVIHETAADRMQDAFKIASAWAERLKTAHDEATEVATALRVAIEKAAGAFIDEFGLDIEIDDAIKIAAFQHLPPFDEEAFKAAGEGGSPSGGDAPGGNAGMAAGAAKGGTPPGNGTHATAVDTTGIHPNPAVRLQTVLAAHAKTNSAGELGTDPTTMPALVGQALNPALDPKRFVGHGKNIADRYVPPEQHAAFYHNASQIALKAEQDGKTLSPNDLFMLAKDKANGVSDNRFLGFAQKNWKPLAAGGAALGLGAAYFLHRRAQREQQERYLNMARQRAGIAAPGAAPAVAADPAVVSGSNPTNM